MEQNGSLSAEVRQMKFVQLNQPPNNFMLIKITIWAVRNITGFLLLKARVAQARQPVLTRLSPREQWAKAQTSQFGWVRCNMQRHQPKTHSRTDPQLCWYLMSPTIKLNQHFYHFISYKALKFCGQWGKGFDANVNKPPTSLF